MSTICTHHGLLNRRYFLSGLGATIALPLLDTMIPLRAGAATPPGVNDFRSRPPLDIVLDYNYETGHLHNGAGAPLYPLNPDYWPKFCRELRKSPPDVLVVGKEAPFTHSMGPMASYGGENQTFPTIDRRDARYRLSPEQLRLRIAAIRRFTDEVHAAGVKKVASYVSLVTMFGDPENRNGFWEFYDHWDEYAGEFSLGPRPEGDPADWPQRTPDGRPYFQMGPDKPHYRPFRRWTVCVNHPGWRAWCKAFTRWIARAGYDGLWIDNAGIQRCYCRHCQALAKQLGLPPLAPSQPRDLIAARNRSRVWIESHLRLWDELRAEGEAIRPGFGIYVNYIEIPFNREVTDHAEVSMIEHVWLGITRVLWPGGIWTGFYPPMPDRKVLYNGTQGTTGARAFENTWAFQLTCAMRGRRGVHWLYGPPAASRDPRFEHNEATALLALAEAAAFGGGSATHVAAQQAFTDIAANGAANVARRRFFHDFLPQHLDLYRGLQPAGNVAIVVFLGQATEGLLEAQQVHEALRWQGVLCDVVSGDTTDAATLQRYRWLVLPGEPTLPDGMKSLPLIRSPAPLTRDESRAVINAYQGKKRITPLRDTGLAARALELIGKEGRLFAPGADGRVAAAARSAPDKIALHLLNYRVPIGRGNADKVETVGPLEISLPLPAASNVATVRAWSPERALVATLDFTRRGPTLRFTLPALRVYELCEISLVP